MVSGVSAVDPQRRPLLLPVDAASRAARTNADPVGSLAQAIGASAALLLPGAERSERLAPVTAFAISAFVPVAPVPPTRQMASRRDPRVLTGADWSVEVRPDAGGLRYRLDGPEIVMRGSVTISNGPDGVTLVHETLLGLGTGSVTLRCELASSTRRSWPRLARWLRTGGTIRADDGTRVSIVRVSGDGHIEGGIGPDPTVSVWGSVERGLVVEDFRGARIG